MSTCHSKLPSLNLDTFDGESTCRVKMLAAPTDEQNDAGTKIGRKLFLMNRRALRARYGCGDDLRVPELCSRNGLMQRPSSSSKR